MIPRNSLSRSLTAILAFACLGAADSTAGDTSDVERSGDIIAVLLPVAAYGYTFAFDDSEGRLPFYKAFGTNIVVTEVLKQAIDKDRPEGNGDRAFPSGHTSVSFQGAAFIHRRYGFKRAIPAYLAASYVGWSRLDADQHDFTDVAAGAALGIATSYFFTEPYKGLTFAPFAGGDSYGFTLSRDW